MTLEIVLLVIAVGFGAFCLYMQTGPRRERTSPQQLALYRRSAYLLGGWTIILLVRLLTHTYT